MKKQITILLICLAIIPMVFAQQSYYEGYKIKPHNLVTNGDFEKGFDSWDKSDYVWNILSPSKVHFSSVCSQRSGYLIQDLKTKVGENYLFEMDLKRIGSNVNLKISLGGESYSKDIKDYDSETKLIFNIKNNEPLKIEASSHLCRSAYFEFDNISVRELKK